MDTIEIVEKLKAGQEVEYSSLKQMFDVAEAVGADTSMARRLGGDRIRAEVLMEAIAKRVGETREAV